MSRGPKATTLTRWLVVAATVGLLVGCGKKQETNTTTESTPSATAESPAAGMTGGTESGAAGMTTSPSGTESSAAGAGTESTGAATSGAGTEGSTSSTSSAASDMTGASAAGGAAAGGATTPTSAGGTPEGHALMLQSDCFSCHAVDKKVVGPAYEWVAYKYKGKKGADKTLAEKVIKGGSGNWNAYTGGVPMPPHPQFTEAQAKTMVDWVLKQKPVKPPKA